MTSSDQDRFLIALGKFLGENPTEPHSLASVLVCEKWLLDEIVTEIIPKNGEFHLDVERFNRLMLNYGRQLCTDHFYDYFFSKAQKLEEFEQAVDTYRIKAMWLFGNFAFGYKKIATSDKGAFQALMERTHPISSTNFEDRPDFKDIEGIAVGDLGLLGYLSGGELRDLDVARKLLDKLLEDPTKTSEILINFGADRQKKIATLLQAHQVSFPEVGVKGLSTPELNEKVKQVSNVYVPLKARHEAAVAVGKRNTHRYLTLPYLDVYVATSMRTDEDYVAQHNFIKTVFDDPQVAPLKLRYFNPTLSYVDDRITKGLVEMLMLRRATVTIYNAGAEDTLGKDSELAATLAQGKAVIVFVPSEPRIVTLQGGKQVDLDKRAELFKIGHPLGLQINTRTGVAHGIIVVRTPAECAQMLRKVILRECSFTIRHEEGNFLLEETQTKSILRVVSDDPFLTHVFWTYFRHLSPEQD